MGLHRGSEISAFFDERVEKLREWKYNPDLLIVCDLLAAILLLHPELVLDEVFNPIFNFKNAGELSL